MRGIMASISASIRNQCWQNLSKKFDFYSCDLLSNVFIIET